MKTASGLIEYCKAQLGKPYWFGTFGQTATQSILAYNRGRFPSYYTASDFQRQIGQRVHDCAGLIKGYLWSDTPTAAPKYNSGGYPDLSADAMRQKCTERGAIDTIPDIPGVLVFMSQHVGVYIGGGQVIEARGHAYGVVQTALKSRGWKWWGKLPYIDYDTEEKGMEYIGNARLQLCMNPEKLTPAQIKAKTGCTAVINGGLYDMAKFRPIAQFKINGSILAKEDWGMNYGLGWDADGQPHMTAAMNDFYNFVGCVCMIRDKKAVKLSYPADMGGARQRSAVGYFPDGRVWMYATSAPTTPEKLQQIAVSNGVEAAIMLDGGASTQCDFPSGSIASARRVNNFILAFAGDTKHVCPYPEPCANVRKGSTGIGAKWVQWMLNQHGYGLAVDGDFGVKSDAALRDFQRSNGLTVDGICGKLTRAVLKNG